MAQRYSSNLPFTSAPEGVGSQHNAPAALPPWKDLVPIV